MARHRRESEDNFEDDELPDGVYYDDTPAMLPCPHCREPVYEEAQYCPRCENYISTNETGTNSRPMWIWICLVLAILSSVYMAFL